MTVALRRHTLRLSATVAVLTAASVASLRAQEGTPAPDVPLADAPVADAPAVDAAAPAPTPAADATADGAEAANGNGGDVVGRDEPGEIDVSPASVLEKVDSWVDGFVRLLPNIVVALVVLALFYALGVVVRRVFRRWAEGRDRGNLGDVLGSFLKWLVVGLGVLLALTIVIPSLKPGDLVAGLGVSSVAIGFAFKDILQNWLAGVLLLMRQPFEIDDQIIVQGYEGAVERIETRATLIRTYDGRRVLIPNSEVYTSAVLVNTAFRCRRSQVDIGIGVEDDIEVARQVMLEAMDSVPDVQENPAPDVQVETVGDFAVILRPRWWTDARRADVVKARTAVVTAIKQALDEAGIEMPYETQVRIVRHEEESDEDSSAAEPDGRAPVRASNRPSRTVDNAGNGNEKQPLRRKS